jgi:hypothetical protein
MPLAVALQAIGLLVIGVAVVFLCGVWGLLGAGVGYLALGAVIEWKRP